MCGNRCIIYHSICTVEWLKFENKEKRRSNVTERRKRVSERVLSSVMRCPRGVLPFPGYNGIHGIGNFIIKHTNAVTESSEEIFVVKFHRWKTVVKVRVENKITIVIFFKLWKYRFRQFSLKTKFDVCYIMIKCCVFVNTEICLSVVSK